MYKSSYGTEDFSSALSEDELVRGGSWLGSSTSSNVHIDHALKGSNNEMIEFNSGNAWNLDRETPLELAVFQNSQEPFLIARGEVVGPSNDSFFSRPQENVRPIFDRNLNGHLGKGMQSGVGCCNFGPKNKGLFKKYGKRHKKQKRGIDEIMKGESRYEDETSEHSLSDSDIEHRNSVLLKESEILWEMSSALGMVFKSNRKQRCEETKLNIVNPRLPRWLWGKDNFVGEFVETVDNSGGLISCWKESFFSEKLKTVSQRYILVIGTIKSVQFKYDFGNIYAPNDDGERLRFWEELTQILGNINVHWCQGDFNVVRCVEKKLGVSYNQVAMQQFSEFIDNLRLVDLPLLGGRYTWCNNRSEPTFCKFDRFLLDPKFLAKFPSLVQKTWPRSLSDHHPISLREEVMNWGPRPFKFFNFWMEEPGFKEMVKKGWEEIELKWSGSEEIHMMENNMGNDVRWENVRNQVLEKKSLLWSLHRAEERVWLQKSRLKWAQEGDKNTAFFHMVASARRRSNWINQIVVQGNSLSEPKEIKEGVAAHFENHFNKRMAVELVELNCSLKKLEESSKNDLERPFSCGEILEAVNDYGQSKAPGPDGLNLDFIRSNWFLVDALPTNYLGLPLGARANAQEVWRPLIDKFYKRLSGWKSEKLSIGDRVLLIKSVQWSDICNSIDNGGLGIVDLKLKNRALMNRWIWRFGVEKDALWRKVVDAKYGGLESDLLPNVRNYRNFSGMWKNITKPLMYNDEFTNTFVFGMGFSLGNRRMIKFWDVEWIPGVKDYGRFVNNEWRWEIALRRGLFGWETQQWNDFYRLIREYEVCANLDDKLIWKGSPSGSYSVKQFCKDHLNERNIWIGFAPPKVEVLCWQLMRGRVAVRSNIAKRGLMQWSEALCLFCRLEVESPEHLFISCVVVWRIWSHWIELWGLSWVIPKDFRRLFLGWFDALPKTVYDQLWKMVFFAIVWTIWLTKNDVVFNDKGVSVEQVIDSSKLKLVHWVKAKWPRILTGW
ncbi:hypothetical protein DITRI_Ditri19aG0085600 [Diplodiscus trichospermus]